MLVMRYHLPRQWQKAEDETIDDTQPESTPPMRQCSRHKWKLRPCEPSLLLRLPPPEARLREANTKSRAGDISSQMLVLRFKLPQKEIAEKETRHINRAVDDTQPESTPPMRQCSQHKWKLRPCEPSLLLSLPPPGAILRESGTRSSADDVSA